MHQGPPCSAQCYFLSLCYVLGNVLRYVLCYLQTESDCGFVVSLHTACHNASWPTTTMPGCTSDSSHASQVAARVKCVLGYLLGYVLGNVLGDVHVRLKRRAWRRA